MVEILTKIVSMLSFYFFMAIISIAIVYALKSVFRTVEFFRMTRFLNISIFDKNSFFHKDDWQMNLFIKLNAMWQQKQVSVGFLLADIQKLNQNNIRTIWELAGALNDTGIKIEKLAYDSLRLERWAKMFCGCDLGYDKEL